MNSTLTFITEQLALAERAAPAPWKVTDHSWSDSSIYDATDAVVCSFSIEGDATEDTQEEWEAKMARDYKFIASVRTNYPAALKMLKVAVEALEIERAHLFKLNNGRTHWQGCETDHPICAALLRAEKALAEIEALGGEGKV